MRAIMLRGFGPPRVLSVEDVEEPRATAGQVVVAVAAAGVNFVETQMRSGRMPAPQQPPFVPGNEVGGTVREVGPGVDPALVDQRVIASLGGRGGYAERVAVDAEALIPVPEGLDVPSAVALLAQGRTAVGVVREARITQGERVLVEAAGGGVGSLIVQLAKRAGAGQVIATAHGRHKLALALELGANAAVDYEVENWAARVRDLVGPGGLDVVFDSVGGTIGRTAFELLADGRGRQVIFGLSSGTPTNASGAEALRRGLTLIGFGGVRMRRPGLARELIGEALALAAEGGLRPVIGQTFPLDHAAEAHAAVESRATVGKTLLVP